MRSFLWRAIGYSLTGLTVEQVIFILWGHGENGKSTLLETLLFMLGGFATKTPAETLLAKRDTGIPNDVVGLRGARLVAAIESDEGRRLAEAKIKELTGGDTIAARFTRLSGLRFGQPSSCGSRRITGRRCAAPTRRFGAAFDWCLSRS